MHHVGKFAHDTASDRPNWDMMFFYFARKFVGQSIAGDFIVAIRNSLTTTEFRY